MFNLDGVYRLMMFINNQYFGLLVECNEGDIIVVYVNNEVVNVMVIYFYGMFQNGINYMDGIVGVIQCFIVLNLMFIFRFDVKGQYGIYWYYVYYSVQVFDGLFGLMVVYFKKERDFQVLDYVIDRVMMVQDYYYNFILEFLMKYFVFD